jgi:DNA-binding NtrC family response regulator
MDDHEERPLTGESTLELTWRGSPGPWVLEVGSSSAGARASLERGGRLVLGSGRDADVRVGDRAVSARHCLVRATDQGIVVEDLGSKNGVFVGGARVTRALLAGQQTAFVIGHSSVVLDRAVEAGGAHPCVTIPGLVGCSDAMLRVASEVARHARLRAPVLLQGETGTGKDVVARALHQLSGRSGAFVPLNVGAIAETLADAELFGHSRGAFTGAVASRPGAFEQAQRGTLFLDEIAELPASIQVKLLRVVEDGMVRPVGAASPVRLDVRLVSASWACLEGRANAQQFRFDLYQRLSTVVIHLPPLRQRKSDIPALSQALLSRIEPELGPKRLSAAALAKLVDHGWPGNVRELGTVLYRAAVACQGPLIDAGHLGLAVATRRAARAVPLAPLTPNEVLALFERHRRNAAAAARAAKVPRTTFRAWLERARDANSPERDGQN